jgi:hypothetical protein
LSPYPTQRNLLLSSLPVTLIGFLALAGIAGASALSGLLLPLLIFLGIALALHFILRRVSPGPR